MSVFFISVSIEKFTVKSLKSVVAIVWLQMMFWFEKCWLLHSKSNTGLSGLYLVLIMKCLLCSYKSDDKQKLVEHYLNYHNIDSKKLVLS